MELGMLLAVVEGVADVALEAVVLVPVELLVGALKADELFDDKDDDGDDDDITVVPVTEADEVMERLVVEEAELLLTEALVPTMGKASL